MNHQLIQQVQQAIDCMEAHLLEEVDLDMVAKAAFMSKSTLYVVFSGLLDMTLKEYIRKRRLSLSTRDLVTSDRRLLDIAVTYGFQSTATYSRAFEKLFGMRPSQYRKEAAYIEPFPRIELHTFHRGGYVMIGKNMNQEQLRQAIRDIKGGYLLDIDIDFFDRINKDFGWDIGDKVLIGVPNRIQEVLAEMELDNQVTRINGDEYVVVFKDIDRSKVELFAKTAITRVETGFVFGETEVPVTISIGIMPFGVEFDEEKVLEETSALLVQAKRNGRNQYAIK